MKVLDSKTYRNVILGRDFLEKFDSVEFYFMHNKVKLYKNWYTCVSLSGKEPVRIQSKLSLTGRSETVINVKCKKSLSLMTVDFEPVPIQGVPAVYATRCRIIPNIQGIFQITLLNVNSNTIEINCCKHIGSLNISRKDIAFLKQNEAKTEFETKLVHNANLSNVEKDQLASLLLRYKDVFASNPKKPSSVKNMTHRIVTEDAQPVRAKPRRIP